MVVVVEAAESCQYETLVPERLGDSGVVQLDHFAMIHWIPTTLRYCPVLPRGHRGLEAVVNAVNRRETTAGNAEEQRCCIRTLAAADGTSGVHEEGFCFDIGRPDSRPHPGVKVKIHHPKRTTTSAQ